MFQLKNVALYSKYHYERSDDIVVDLIKCLQADGYTPLDKWDVCSIISNNTEEFIPKNKKLYNIIEELSKENCHRFGYYCKGNIFNLNNQDELPYDTIMALIYFCLSTLSNTELVKLGDIGKPNSNVLPIKKHKK